MNTERQRLKLDEITQINKWVRKFRFVPAEVGQKLAPFLPGQYLNLFYEVDGVFTSRPYSITSSPGDAELGFYELYIHGGGTFTAAWLFAFGQKGMLIDASVPEGEFVYDPKRDGGNIIGISGGMSVTPLCSMARAVEEGTLDANLTVFCSWDNYKDVLFYDEFMAIAQRCPRFRVIFTLAKENHPGFQKGFVTLDMIRSAGNPENAAFFMCGPKEMYDSLDKELASLNVPADRLHREIPGEVKFGFPGTEGLRQGQLLSLTLHDGREVRHIPMRSHETVLIALERAGVKKETRCRSGRCGYCRSRLLSGQVYIPSSWKGQEHTEQEDTLFHPCCSFPLSNLEIALDE